MRRTKRMSVLLMGLFVGATLFACTSAHANMRLNPVVSPHTAEGDISTTVPSTRSSGIPSTGPAPTVSSPGSPDQEVVYWQTVQNSHNIAELEAYLRRFPDGMFADIAKARITELKQTAPSEFGRGQPIPHNQQQALAKTPSVPLSARVATSNIDQIRAVIRTHTFWCFGDDHGFFRWRLDRSGNFAYSSYTAERNPIRDFGFYTSGSWQLTLSADRKQVIIDRTVRSGPVWNPIEEVNDPQLGHVLGLRVRSVTDVFVPCDEGPVFVRKELP
jgi:hypothetical protein